MLKIWYCGDGGLQWCGEDRAYAQIRPMSFNGNSVKNILDKFDLEYSIQESGTVCFYGDTAKFLDRIGPAPRGMEYKWETDKRDRYNRLKA
jgi:hypothetical protein